VAGSRAQPHCWGYMPFSAYFLKEATQLIDNVKKLGGYLYEF